MILMKHLYSISTLLLCVLLTCCHKEPVQGGGSDMGKEEPVKKKYREGITRISDDSLAFVLFAPGKTQVHLIGDFNDWSISDGYKMEKDGNYFRIEIGRLSKNREYICQYLIDDRIRIADPYSTKISDPQYDDKIPNDIYPNLISYPTTKTSEIAMVVNTALDPFPWQIERFTLAPTNELIIYELLIRDFTEKRTIKGVQEKIPYLLSLGINAIELMPFNEFEGNDSWGYNPSFYFAPDKIYGTSNDYKAFIDLCHQNGIAVIMDMVLNHSYGESPLVRMYQNSNGTPSSANPWYNTTSPNQTYSWGYDFNHESQYTRQFVDSVCVYWMEEYKIDGFRFDFTKGFTNTPGDGWNYDPSRINILKRIANHIWSYKSDALVILEHLTDNSEEKVLAQEGMLLWGNLNYRMNEATMGWTQQNNDGSWNSDISWGVYTQRGWERPHLVTYMESHDEERLMYKNTQYGKEYGGYNVKDPSTALQRTAAAAVLFFSLPGPKMIWQFGELGYDYFLGSSAQEGRLEKKPIRWDYFDDLDRKALFDTFAAMIDLRKRYDVFTNPNYSLYELERPFKYIASITSNQRIVAMANFDVVEVTQDVNFFYSGGIWREFFTNHQIDISDSADTFPITLLPGEYRLYFRVNQ